MSDSRYALIPSAAIEDERVTNTDLRVLCALGAFLSNKLEAYPTQKSISERARVSRQSVNTSLKKLAELGYVIVVGQARSGLKRALKYRVVLDVKLSDIDAETVMNTDVGLSDSDVAKSDTSPEYSTNTDVAKSDSDVGKSDNDVAQLFDSLLSPPELTAKEDTQLKIPTTRAEARKVRDQIVEILPPKKRKATGDSFVEVIRKVLKDHPADVLLGAVRRCYVDEAEHTEQKGQFAPAVHSWIKDGVWKHWTEDEVTASTTQLSDEEWKSAMRHWLDEGDWLIPDISPAPDQPDCKVPAGMRRFAANQLKATAPERSAAILAHLKPEVAA